VRPLYEHYRASHSVFAIDLPGFCFSERSDRDYTPRLMTDAVLAVAAEIDIRAPGPIAALALSLSCEFLARAESESPGRFARLALVSPTGFNGRARRRAPAGTTRGLPWLYRLLRGPTPAWRQGLFRALTRPGVIRYFLERTWGSRQIDETLWRYCQLSSQLPGAEFAPLHFLAADIFSADIHSVYEALRPPVWVSHGRRGDFTDYRSLDLVRGRPNWRCTVFDSGALPYFELPGQFLASAQSDWLGR
jgi:pimeloyl-ACP methyl ester carboxylesterase